MSELTKSLADRINQSYELSRQHAKQAIDHALDCGAALNEAKKQVKHGEWLPWLEANTSIPERTANSYMWLEARRDRLESISATVADLTVRGARALLDQQDADKRWSTKHMDEAHPDSSSTVLWKINYLFNDL